MSTIRDAITQLKAACDAVSGMDPIEEVFSIEQAVGTGFFLAAGSVDYSHATARHEHATGAVIQLLAMASMSRNALAGPDYQSDLADFVETIRAGIESRMLDGTITGGWIQLASALWIIAIEEDVARVEFTFEAGGFF